MLSSPGIAPLSAVHLPVLAQPARGGTDRGDGGGCGDRGKRGGAAAGGGAAGHRASRRNRADGSGLLRCGESICAESFRSELAGGAADSVGKLDEAARSA
jgi:hypothetical protein